MPANLMSSDTQNERVSRCQYCFKTLNCKKKDRVVRRILINDQTIQANICDERCGDLWQAQMRKEFDRQLAYIFNQGTI